MKELLLEFLSTILNEARVKAVKIDGDEERIVYFDSQEAAQAAIDASTHRPYLPTDKNLPSTKPTKRQQPDFLSPPGKQEKPIGSDIPKGLLGKKGKEPSLFDRPSKVSAGLQTPIGNKILQNLKSGDRDKIFGYIDNSRKRVSRHASLEKLTTLAERPELSPDKQKDAVELKDSLAELLTAYSEYTTTGSQKSKNTLTKLANQLQEKYKFFTNSSGISFKTQHFGTKHRHILAKPVPRKDGTASNLSGELVDIFDVAGINLRNEKQGDKQLKNQLSASSKPSMGEPVYGVARPGKGRNAIPMPPAPRVEELFKSMQFIDEKYRSVFGPTTGEPPDLVDNTNGKNARIYFEHSVTNNTSLADTENVLRENGLDGMADSIKAHRERLQTILKNFDKMKPADREKAVQNSYSEMALSLHRPPTGDSELCGSIMKNLAEVNLYDQEISAGKEVYLPAPGSFPAADKLVRTNAGTKGERVSGISVKYGKSGKVYGMPAQSSTITLFHPEEFYHEITTGRVGTEGYEIGVRADVLEKKKWEKIMNGSGHGSVLSKTEQEQLRLAAIECADFVAKSKPKKASNIDIREAVSNAENSVHAKKIHAILFGNPEDPNRIAKLTKQFGQERISLLRKHPMAFPAMLAVDSAIVTGDGFPQLLHCHQEISEVERGSPNFVQAVEPGSADLSCWHQSWRSTDERGGGIIMGYNCGH